MIKSYLRLDLFVKNANKVKLVDQVDLEPDEDVHDLLQGFDDCDYAELVFTTSIGYDLHESLATCFRRIKLKNNRDYNWLVCQSKEI